MSGDRQPKGPPWAALTPERIRAARKALGLKQEEFALLIGRRRRFGTKPYQKDVSRWERGVRKPDALWGPVILAVVLEVERRAQRAQSERTEMSHQQT